MAKVIGLYGAGGFGREVMPLLKAQCGQKDKLFFVETEPEKSSVYDIPVIAHDEFLGKYSGQAFFNIAIGNSQIRQSISEQCKDANITPLDIKSETSEIIGPNNIGDGTILCGFTTITSDAKIGAFFHANIYSYVAHDCVIGDFVTFAPRVNCNGNVHIGNHAYIGTGAVLKQGTEDRPLTIGEGSVVGMGAVVTKDVPPGTTVVGNPAREFKR